MSSKLGRRVARQRGVVKILDNSLFGVKSDVVIGKTKDGWWARKQAELAKKRGK